MKNHKLLVLLLIALSFIVGCGKPTTPDFVIPDDLSGGYKVVAQFSTIGYAQDVLKKDNLLYVAVGEGGLEIIDVSDPYNPITVSNVNEGVRGYSAKIASKDSAVYLAAGSFGVSVVDVANPEEPIATASNLPMKPAKAFHILGDYLFTAISEQGIKITDVSYPTQPDPRGSISTPGYAHGIASTLDTVHLLVACGEVGLSMIDISDFQNGHGNYREVGLCNTPGYAETVTLLDEESLAFMACGTSGLQIVNYSDTLNIHIVGSFDGPGYAKDLIYKNGLVYMTTETGGFQIIDVSNISSPKLLGWIETEYSLGLDMDDDYIYVADEEMGILVISIPK
jgi:hypothetical protein